MLRQDQLHLYPTLPLAAEGAAYSVTLTKQGCAMKYHCQPEPDIAYDVTACKWRPCHRTAVTWKIHEHWASWLKWLMRKVKRWAPSSESHRNWRWIWAEIHLKKNVFCWLKKHIAVSVDGYCKVLDPEQVEPLRYTNGRFIAALTWQLGAHLHSWHLRLTHSNTHGQFSNELRLSCGAVFFPYQLWPQSPDSS